MHVNSCNNHKIHDFICNAVQNKLSENYWTWISVKMFYTFLEFILLSFVYGLLFKYIHTPMIQCALNHRFTSHHYLLHVLYLPICWYGTTNNLEPFIFLLRGNALLLHTLNLDPLNIIWIVANLRKVQFIPCMSERGFSDNVLFITALRMRHI